MEPAVCSHRTSVVDTLRCAVRLVEMLKLIAKTQRFYQRSQCPPKYTESKHFQQ